MALGCTVCCNCVQVVSTNGIERVRDELPMHQ